jgi:hypothetical protein
MGPLDVLGLLGISRRHRYSPKVCRKCGRFIKIGQGYKETKDGFYHGGCVNVPQAAKEGQPAEEKEAPPG